MILSITAEYFESTNILLANSFPYISNLFHFLHYAVSNGRLCKSDNKLKMTDLNQCS